MKQQRTGSESALRTIDVLFAFEEYPVATIKQISEFTAIPLPTAHRYVAMLKDIGLVSEAGNNAYRLTMRMAGLASAARNANSTIDVAAPFLQRLSADLGETVLLVQLISGKPVCTYRVEASRRLRLSFEVGQRMPALRGASSHLLLSGLSIEERRSYVEQILSEGEQEPTVEIEEFLDDVQRAGDLGWATSSAEIDEGVWSAAALVKVSHEVIATISVPCPTVRIDAEKEELVRDSVCKVAAEIATALGGGQSRP
ncbi:IclR family transcriptional regulator [Brevibacterium sp. SIMBA_078]|uniref:IclR family transcriptional regulator n=1 Tax=Brevibacterium sp. SIMBA_078 TaxID=3085816 RepID=UPI00397D45BA